MNLDRRENYNQDDLYSQDSTNRYNTDSDSLDNSFLEDDEQYINPNLHKDDLENDPLEDDDFERENTYRDEFDENLNNDDVNNTDPNDPRIF